jgi:hypothetical protein
MINILEELKAIELDYYEDSFSKNIEVGDYMFEVEFNAKNDFLSVKIWEGDNDEPYYLKDNELNELYNFYEDKLSELYSDVTSLQQNQYDLESDFYKYTIRNY